MLTLEPFTGSIKAFIELLAAHGVTQRVDLRTAPRSRHKPQFNVQTWPQRVAAVNIGFAHAPGLRSFRHATPGSPNGGWRNLSFRSYADCMQTTDFTQRLVSLIGLAQRDRVALMGPEALPWRRHRSLIADALAVRGVASCDIVSPKRLHVHTLTPFARVSGREISALRVDS